MFKGVNLRVDASVLIYPNTHSIYIYSWNAGMCFGLQNGNEDAPAPSQAQTSRAFPFLCPDGLLVPWKLTRT